MSMKIVLVMNFKVVGILNFMDRTTDIGWCTQPSKQIFSIDCLYIVFFIFVNVHVSWA